MVIQRVRSLARHEAPRRERMDLNAVVDEALQLARGELERNGIGLELALAEALPAVLADRVQLHQVVGNLLLNAIEAMASGPEAGRRIVIATAREEQSVILAVADSGIGFAAGAQERLFEAFWTTREGAPASA